MTNKTYAPSAENQYILATLDRLDNQFVQLARLIGETSPRLQQDLNKIFEERGRTMQEILGMRSDLLLAGFGTATQFAINNGAKFVPVEPIANPPVQSVPEWLMPRALEFVADGQLDFHSDFPRLGTMDDLHKIVIAEEGRMTTTGVYDAGNGRSVLASIYSHANREHLVTATWDSGSGTLAFEHQILLITEKTWVPDPTTRYLDRDVLELQYVRTSPKYTAATQVAGELVGLSELDQNIQQWVSEAAEGEDRLSKFQSALEAGRDFSGCKLDVVGDRGPIQVIYKEAHLKFTPLVWQVSQLKIVQATLEALSAPVADPVVLDGAPDNEAAAAE